MRTKALPATLATLALAVSGCGVFGSSEDSSESNLDEQQSRPAGAGAAQVAASDVETVILARQKISNVCDGGPDAPPRSELLPAVAKVKAIVELGPSDRFESGQTETPQTMSSVANDLAGILDKCNAGALAAELRSVATGEVPVQEGSPGY